MSFAVAIFEHRFTKEFSNLFEKLGAKVYACPMLEEKPVENRGELQEFIRQTVAGNLDMMIFLTGVGARFLVAEAEAMGTKDAYLAALNKLVVVVRGPKPVAALRQFGIRIEIVPVTPTTEGVIEALRSRDLKGTRIGIQLYGTPNPQLVSALETKGARVTPVQVYAYGAATDSSVVREVIERIIKREIDVAAFTSAPQVQMLFDIAGQLGLSAGLAASLKEHVTIASIGEVTNRALAEKGLSAKILPQQPKMGSLAQAVGDFFQKKPRSGDRL